MFKPLGGSNQFPVREYKLGGAPSSKNFFAGINLWRQRQNNRRWIQAFIEVDQGRTLLATLTFKRYESLIHAKETGRRMVRRWQPLIDGWVRILERGGGGVHLHFVLHVLFRLQAGTEIEAVAAVVRQHQSKERIGHWEVEPVRDAEAMSEYLTKQLRPGNKRYRVKSRAFTYSLSVTKEPWWLARD